MSGGQNLLHLRGGRDGKVLGSVALASVHEVLPLEGNLGNIPLLGRKADQARYDSGDPLARNAVLRVGKSSDWIAVRINGKRTCGIKTDKTVWCWGCRAYRQTDCSSTEQTDPTWRAWTKGFVRICNRIGTSLFDRTRQGAIEGKPFSCYDGTGIPKRRERTEWAEVTIGDRHLCGLRHDGQLRCRGLFGGGFGAAPFAVRIAKGYRWSSVVSGQHHACGLRTDGSLWCWGDNQAGQLGDGSTVSRRKPVQVGNQTDWAAVSTTHEHTCGLKKDGALWCWGGHENDRALLDLSRYRTMPVKVQFD